MTSSPITVYGREAYYIRCRQLTSDDIQTALEANTFQFYKDAACEKCEYFQDRPTDTCEECPNNLGTVKLAKTKLMPNGKKYLLWPIGDRKGLQRFFEGREIVFKSQWPDVDMRRPIEFVGKLWKEQTAAVADVIAKRRGVLKAPPRSGKTVMAASVIAALNKKTLILAAQRDWLVNFYETFVGSETQKPLTNISKKRCGFANKLEEFERYDVALATYQTFLSEKGQRLLAKLRKMFTVLCIDEVHRGAATGHARVISALSTQYKIGLSGTPQRKDGKHKLMHRIVGPVIHTMRTQRLVPRVAFTPTGVAPTYEYKTWTAMIRYLEMNPGRLKLIAKWAIKDAAAGHMVLIPLNRVAAIRALTKAINRIAGKDIAAEFYGGVPKFQRDKVIELARNYKIKIIVGNTKLLSTGINIPRASCLYQCTPSSNLPNAEQRVSRILTLHDGKPQPLWRVFADDMGVVKNCFRSEWWGVVYKTFRPQMTDDVKDKLYAWMNSTGKRRNPEFQGGFHSGGSI